MLEAETQAEFWDGKKEGKKSQRCSLLNLPS